jgi:primase-polymerase (primpol)-like protein
MPACPCASPGSPGCATARQPRSLPTIREKSSPAQAAESRCASRHVRHNRPALCARRVRRFGRYCNIRFADKTAFEIYDTARFVTVTGQHVGGTPRDLREIPLVELERVCAEMMARLPVKPPATIAAPTAAAPITLDDQDVLRRMFASRNGAQLARLYHGQHGYASQSDADIRLAGALAFWTGRNAAQMDRLFRASGLMRTKWDSRRGETTYGAATITTACANCTVTVSRGRGRGR